MTFTASTWPEVVERLEGLAQDGRSNAWAAPMYSFAKKVAASQYKRVFHPSLSALTQSLFLSQTKEYEASRGVLCVRADGEFEFTYQDSGIEEHWWRRRCPPDAALAVLERAVEHLHLVVRYGNDA
jgi:hypothetical protein